MKKGFVKILTISFVLLASWGCASKTSITTNAFSVILKKHDFEIIDISEQYKKYEDIKTIFIGKNKEKYQIEYYVLKDEETTKKIFNKNLNNLSSLSSGVKTKTEGDNFIKYTITTNTYYVVLSKVENTFIYVETPSEYQTEINEILKEMNY